jgi:serine protease AprX
MMLALLAGIGSSQPATVLSSQWVIIDGQRWALYKVVRAGREEHLFRGPGGETLTLAEMAARFPAPAVDPALRARIARVPAGTAVPVIAILRSQPIEGVTAGVDRSLAARAQTLRARSDALLLGSRAPGARLSAAEAREARSVALGWKQLRQTRNAQIVQEAGRRTASEQTVVANYVRALGGRARGGFRMVNMVAASLPAGQVAALAAHPLVAHVAEDVPDRGHLNVSIPAIGVDTSFWSNGFTGGVYDAAIVDTGMDASHPAFAGKTISNRVCHVTAQTYFAYADNAATGDDLQGHGTHVGGIVMSQGATTCTGCRGVARGLDVTHNLKAGFLDSAGDGLMFNSDRNQCIDATGGAASAYNLSFGSTATIDYDSSSQWIDAAIRNFGIDFAVSAGNDGPSNTQYGTPATAFNIMSVASMNDQNTTGRGDDRISSFSSRGPTAAGRKKPDLAAPGSSINSAFYDWESTGDFANFSGTSMAAPHVAGAYVLLWNAGLNMMPTHARKALLINSADAWSDNGTPADGTDDGQVAGSLWNRVYGWGYINMTNAFSQRMNVFTGSVTATDPEDSFFVVGDMTLNQKATAVWEKRNTYNGTSTPTTLYALTDIDLHMFRESDNSLLVSSLSGLDNVEQVAAPSANRMVLKADVTGATIQGAASESLSIAAQGTNVEAGVRGPTIRMTSMPVVCPGSSFTATARVRHWGNISSHNNTATLSVPGGFAITGGANPQSFLTIAAGQRGTATWTIMAPGAGSGVFANTGNVNTFNEIWNIVHNLNVVVQNPSFSDVPCGDPFYGFIERILATGVTSGCVAGQYCPGNAVDRRQMAAFIIRAMGEAPVACTGIFADVPIGAQFCGHIERMAQLGITSGCAAGLYCPTGLVSRGQMAVFIVRARVLADARWAAWAKPVATFSDVPTSHPFQAFIERLALEQVTDGCTATTYCPDFSITRGQMAVFLVRAFPSQW